MKTIYDAINSHVSIRKYKNRPIPKEVLERVLHAGTRASSSGNMQTYSIIVTSDEDVKRKLLPFHFDQSMLMEAPTFLTFCSDFHRMRLWLEENQAPENFDNFMSFLIGMIDATLASQNVALAAEAEGLGICYMGTTLASCKEISKVLELPSQVVPVVGFSIGYPDETPKVRDRLPLSGIIHHEVYRDYTKEDIQRIYAQKEIDGMKRYLSDPELNKIIQAHGIENLAQIYTKVKYTKESHISYSNDVLKCLKEQFFMNN